MKKETDRNLLAVKNFMDDVKMIAMNMNVSVHDYMEYFIDDADKIEFSDNSIKSSSSIINLISNANKSNKDHQVIDYIIQKDKNIKKINQAIVAVKSLPELLQRVAYLYFFEFMTYGQVGEILVKEDFGIYDNPQISRMMKEIYKRLTIILGVVLAKEGYLDNEVDE